MSNENIFKRYWLAYGGFKSIAKSYYFWLSIVITLVLFPRWSSIGWWEDVFVIMPNLLGFSLGGFAMWVAIGDEKFKSVIAGSEKNETSPFMMVNATFAHFILLQLLSVVLALLASSYMINAVTMQNILNYVGQWVNYLFLFCYFFSYLIFIYSLFTAFAAVMGLFRVSSWYDDMKTQETKQKSEP